MCLFPFELMELKVVVNDLFLISMTEISAWLMLPESTLLNPVGKNHQSQQTEFQLEGSKGLNAESTSDLHQLIMLFVCLYLPKKCGMATFSFESYFDIHLFTGGLKDSCTTGLKILHKIISL